MSEPVQNPRSPARQEWDPLLEALPQGVVLLDGAGRVIEANGVAQRLLRQDRSGLLSQSLFRQDCRLLAPGGTALAPEDFPGTQSLGRGVPVERAMVGLGWEDGVHAWLEYSTTPLAEGGLLMTFEDRTEAYYAQAILAARTRIGDLAATATLEAILRATLDEAELLTGSCIGFYHFMDQDQGTLTLQAWSTRTGRDFCKAEGHGLHYPVSQAGVWVDAVRQGVPVIHNDYPSLPHRKGLPAGHAHVLRELVVPVLRGGRIVALLGVGNKPDPYGPRDVETVQQFADVAWEVAEKKRTELALLGSEARYRALFDHAPIGISEEDFSDLKQALDRLRDTHGSDLRPYLEAHPEQVAALAGLVRILAVNQASAQALGIPLREEGAPGLPSFFTPESLALFREEVLTLAAGGGFFRGEVPLTDLEGRPLVLDTSVQIQPGSEDTWARVLVSFVDITKRKHAEEALFTSQAQHLSMLRTAMDAVWLMDAQGRILEVNDAACFMLGYGREELLGKAPSDLEAVESQAETRAHFELILQRGWDIFESVHRRRDGTTLPVEVSATHLPDTGQFVAYIRDMTARKGAEEALRSSEEAQRQVALRDEAILSNLSEGLVLYDPEGGVLLANRSTSKIWERWGLAPPANQAGTLAMVEWLRSGDRDLPMSERPSARVLRGEHFTEYEVSMKVKGADAPFHGSYSGVPFYDDRGKLLYGIVTFRDISDRKRLELERLELEHQFQRAQKMESLGSLAGGVAHDMNNVLGAIMALSSIQETLAPQGSSLQRSMETISKACLRGRTLVQGLLGFARQGITEERLLNLNEVVREQTALLEHTTLQRVRLEMELDPALAPVLGDPAALGHALMNLCVNAVDAMPEGGTLALRTRNAGPTLVELEIQDSGKGMPPEVLAKAMDPFFTTKPQGKGTGLGLSIVYGTVKSHRGRLDLHSTEGVGTRITIQLPAAARELGPGPLVAPPTPNSRPLRVLVVDDDDLLQMSLCTLLETLGHAPEAVDSGEAALALLETGAPFDLVILDLNMPGLGGAGTLPLLRLLRTELPVVLATGRATQQAAELAAGTPAVSILAKPFSLEELKGHLAVTLRRKDA
ncbi:MAG: PAS domain S-box protein [Holophagaceae bacterium]|nr:PAS domain S-box protein [Holophagaceae bacterium]